MSSLHHLRHQDDFQFEISRAHALSMRINRHATQWIRRRPLVDDKTTSRSRRRDDESTDVSPFRFLHNPLFRCLPSLSYSFRKKLMTKNYFKRSSMKNHANSRLGQLGGQYGRRSQITQQKRCTRWLQLWRESLSEKEIKSHQSSGNDGSLFGNEEKWPGAAAAIHNRELDLRAAELQQQQHFKSMLLQQH